MSSIQKLLYAFVVFSVMLTVSWAERPNVLFIVIDDLNDVPGFMGVNPDAKTPSMDALAAQGTVFKNAHCSYPLCGPSRASFLSGMKPATLGFQTNMEYSELKSRTDSLTHTSWTPVASSLGGAAMTALNGTYVVRAGTDPILVDLTVGPWPEAPSAGFFKIEVEPLF